MLYQLSKYLVGAGALVIGLSAVDSAHAQRTRSDREVYRYDRDRAYGERDRDYRDRDRYEGRYTVRRPAYDDTYRAGRTQSIVTHTPMGPVQSSSRIDPRTGEQVSTTYWRDPRTGQVTTSRRVVDPRTGEDRATTRTTDPYTGAVQRSRVVDDPYSDRHSVRTSGVDPWSGVPYRSQRAHSPYGDTYEHDDPYYGGSRVIVPHR
jgi:hypothetical protein